MYLAEMHLFHTREYKIALGVRGAFGSACNTDHGHPGDPSVTLTPWATGGCWKMREQVGG